MSKSTYLLFKILIEIAIKIKIISILSKKKYNKFVKFTKFYSIQFK